MNVKLHIEPLVLDGLPVEGYQAAYIQAAVEAELARLIAENGLAAHLHAGGAVPSLNANAIQFTSGGSATQTGTQIAQSVYGAIGNKK